MKKQIAAILLAACVTVAAGVSMRPVQTADAATTKEEYTTYIKIGDSTNVSELILEPVAVLEAEKFTDIAASKARNVIIQPDADMNVQFQDGAKPLKSTVNSSSVKNYRIPVVRLTADTVDAFIEWQTNKYEYRDMMVLSSDLEVIKKVYETEATKLLNSVYDLTDKTIGSDRYWAWQYIGAANAAGCNILMLDATDPNFAVAAEYISAMTKICWGYAEDKTEAVKAIAGGAYGVVSKNDGDVQDALKTFNKSGWARAQYIAAHRGITAYCNQQSLTAVAAGVNEGATHLELDLQVTRDRKLMICHDGQSSYYSDGNRYFALSSAAEMQKLTLTDYSSKYQDTFPFLTDVIELVKDTDVILILELKLDNGSRKAVEELKAIETLRDVMAQYPEMTGRWYTITFYAPYAEDMRRVLPEIPVGYLGGATSSLESENNVTGWNGMHVGTTNISGKISQLRTYNLGLDEMWYDNANATIVSNVNDYAKSYLARGYVANGWTYEDCLHFNHRINVATTNAAEACAMLVKNISSAPLTLTAAQYESGKATVSCTTYCGWQKNLECDIIEVERTDNTAKALLYYYQKAPDSVSGNELGYGLYSELVTVTIS